MENARIDRISWPHHHMLLAQCTALRSPDPSTQVGACIVDSSNRVIGLGYNGLPRGMKANSIDWDRTIKEFMDVKYTYVVHAERNAILNAHSTDLEDCVLYTTLFPCNICAQGIVQTGIKTVYYLENKYPDSGMSLAASFIFRSCGVECHKLDAEYEIVHGGDGGNS